jgi:hypothetical protein
VFVNPLKLKAARNQSGWILRRFGRSLPQKGFVRDGNKRKSRQESPR